jgi:hypothetical protein
LFIGPLLENLGPVAPHNVLIKCIDYLGNPAYN